MKICILNTYADLGGAARAAARLFHGLVEIGADCRMFVHHGGEDAPNVVPLADLDAAEIARAREVQAEVERERAPYASLRGPGAPYFHSDRAPVGEAMVRQMPEADVVNLHWVRDFVDYGALFGALRPNQRVVWTLHDMAPFTGGCHYAGYCEGFKSACGRCPLLESKDPNDLSARILRRKLDAFAGWRERTHVVAPSRWMAGKARESRLFEGVPVSVIPYGLDTDVFKPHDSAEVRRAFGLPPDLRLIMFIAHKVGDPRKGLVFLDEALCQLGPHDDTALLLVGDQQVEMVAPVPQLRTGAAIWDDGAVSRLYAAADLVVVPSLEDNLPNTILEAMACGVPVVAFDVGGAPDLITPGETGFLAPPADSAALAAALDEALSDLDRLRTMGRAARRVIERSHTLEVQASAYLKLFREMMETAPRVAAG